MRKELFCKEKIRKLFSKTLLAATILGIVVFIDIALAGIGYYTENNFGYLSLSQLYFHLLIPVDPVHCKFFLTEIKNLLLLDTLVAIITIFIGIKVFDKIFASKKSDLKLAILLISIGVFSVICYALFQEKVPITSIYKALIPSKMFKEHFEDVPIEKISFKQKRNVILIIAESLENSYANSNAVGRNLIPKLSKLQEENLTFSRRVQCNGSGWTLAGLVNIFFGIPHLPLHGGVLQNESNNRSWNCNSLFKVFLGANYNCTFMQGGHMSFANKKNLFIPTPEVKIISYEQLKDNPIFKANEKPFEWGVDDEVLFEHLYKETLQLAKKDKPFFLSLLTLDTHFPTGYLPPKYNVTPEEYYPKVLELTDKRITQFAHWLQQQPFGKNTTLIIVGDHLTMPNQLHNQLTKFNGQDPICGRRTTYNCFINSAVTPSKKINRIFAAFDLTPTILHAAGANWGSNKFNLGVSLFGKSKTLLEEKGIPWYEEHSLRYQKEYIDMISFH